MSNHVKHDQISGLIIAGGKSARMGKQDKLALKLGHETLVERALNRLAISVQHIGVNIPKRNEIYQLPEEIDVIEDKIAVGQGPLAGIAAGLAWAKQKDDCTTHLLLAPGDAPFFPKNLINDLYSEENEDAIIMPFVASYSQPLFSLWPLSLLDPLDQFLNAQSDRKVMNFIKQQNWKPIDISACHEDTFLNVNTPEDWVRAQIIFESGIYE